MKELLITEEVVQALNVHLPTLKRRKAFLLQNAQNNYALKEAAAITWLCDWLCPAVEGACDE